MAEYIEREALIKAASKNIPICRCEADFVDIKKLIEDMPAADVAPVVHSSWEEIKDVPHGIWDYHFRCKHCGGNTPQATYVVAPDYCPNCGAKMDESPEQIQTTD